MKQRGNAWPPGLARQWASPKPYWPAAPKRPKGAPSILVVLFDDVGFSDFGCYGSPIATPAIDAIAGRGLRYTGLPHHGDVARPRGRRC